MWVNALANYEIRPCLRRRIRQCTQLSTIAHARGVRKLTTKTQLIAVSLSSSTDVLAYLTEVSKNYYLCQVQYLLEVEISDLR